MKDYQLGMKVKAGVMKPPKTPKTKPSTYNHVREMRRKEERKKQSQTNNKAKQHKD